MDLQLETKRSLQRIKERLDLNDLTKSEALIFNQRLEEHFPQLFNLLFQIYGHRYDMFFHLQTLVNILVDGYRNRSKALKAKDKRRLQDPHWYQKEDMLGMAVYVDLFASDLSGLISRIPYLKSLGITYLHLMPLYDCPSGDSDGGYAVSNYRKVNPKLGSIEDLEVLARELAKNDISLVLDFVFNHTSNEHPWARLAQQGNPDFQQYYYMFDEKTVPEQYEQNLREIFPQVRRGNFTWDQTAQKWVWTTFNSFQWDLNYSNPVVFNSITEEMLFLANIGCEALRLDALAFIWKQMGTSCENQPKAHTLIQAFNACLQIAAPAVVFKSEAIVHPDEVLKYIDPQECQLSYNPLLMALIWNSLATRKTRLLTESMNKSFTISPQCSWVNYVRCHDDIGWTFDDNVAQQLGINGTDHRHFLNQFYTGQFEGSFSTGVAFGENPSTGDCRVCGSLASLAGLEQAIEKKDKQLEQHAIARILLVHSIILSIGGVPLLYSGDELGLLNDYSYQTDSDKQHDARWVQRIAINQQDIAKAQTPSTPQYQIANGLQKLIGLRKQHAVFGQAPTQIMATNNDNTFAYLRTNEQGERLLAICNFSEESQHLDSHIIEQIDATGAYDLISQHYYHVTDAPLTLSPYQVLWFYKAQ